MVSCISGIWVENKTRMADKHLTVFVMWEFSGLYLKVEIYDLELLAFVFEKIVKIFGDWKKDIVPVLLKFISVRKVVKGNVITNVTSVFGMEAD